MTDMPAVDISFDENDIRNPEVLDDLFVIENNQDNQNFADSESGRTEPFEGETTASNNWALAPELTETGRPILANDPHRDHAVPSLRYIAHISAPEFDIIGGGEPGLPGISIGHMVILRSV